MVTGDMAAGGDGTARKTACVTGGSGYIASALVKMLLERGYAVKTTVRNPGNLNRIFVCLRLRGSVRGTLRNEPDHGVLGSQMTRRRPRI